MKVEVSIDPACKEPKVIIHYAFAQKTSAGQSTKPILDAIMQKDN
jgi:hypothetical protein